MRQVFVHDLDEDRLEWSGFLVVGGRDAVVDGLFEFLTRRAQTTGDPRSLATVFLTLASTDGGIFSPGEPDRTTFSTRSGWTAERYREILAPKE